MKTRHVFNREEYKNILKSFDEKCKLKKIWYSLADSTLLSAILNKNFYLQNDHLHVFMTIESFNILLANYKNYIIDSSINSNYCYLTPFFVDDNVNVVIQIHILVPALIKNTEHCYSITNLNRQKLGYYMSNKNISNFKRFWILSFFKLMNRFQGPITWKEIYSKIFDEKKFNGYFVIDTLEGNVNKHWIPTLSFNTSKISFLDLDLPIIKETNIYLEKKFGVDYKINNLKIKKSPKYKWIKTIQTKH